MRALTLSSFDGPDAVSLGDVPEPHAAPGQVVVAVEAAGIGAWDVQSTRGAFASMGGASSFPQVLGWDFTGRIAEVGPDVSRWKVGDGVLGFTAQPWTGAGSFASFLAVDATTVTSRPDTLRIDEAAALPVSGLTADLVARAAGASAGTRVLVLGATGGVGALVTQLVARAGGQVIASVSPGRAEVARSLGASDTVDRAGDVAAEVLGSLGEVDVLVDLVGPSAWTGAIAALRRGGRFVTTVPLGTPDDERGVESTVIGVQPDAARLERLASLLAAGDLLTPVARVVPLADGPAQFASFGAGGTTGKVVLDLSSA